MTKFMINSSIPSGVPIEALVVDPDGGQWVIVSREREVGRRRTEGAKPIVEDLAAKRGVPFVEALGGYFGSGSYSHTSDWTESPLDYQKTCERLYLELQPAHNKSLQDRQMRLARLRRAAVDTDLDLVGVSENVPEDRWEEFRNKGVTNTTLTIVVPDADRERIIANFEGRPVNEVVEEGG